MALSTTTATTTASAYISRQNISSPKNCATKSSNWNTFGSKTWRFSIRSSGDVSPTVTEENSESSIEAPKIPSSLISALNVEKAFRGIAITDVDHYGTLGIKIGCPYDQVTVAYKKRVEEVKNMGLAEEQLKEKLELLRESREILSSVEERRLYDWSLARTMKSDRYTWPFEADITQIPTQPGPPEEPEDEGPTRLVGYFFLSWIILGFILSITLSRS